MKLENLQNRITKEQNKKYEKSADEIASTMNTDSENLKKFFGLDTFNKQDVIRADAELENEIRNELSKLSKIPQNKVKIEELEDKLKKIENSSVLFDEKEYHTNVGWLYRGNIQGEIKDHKVEIQEEYHYYSRIKGIPNINSREYYGKIDDIDLSLEEGRKIFNEYKLVAEMRTNKILVAQKNWERRKRLSEETKEQEKKSKILEKQKIKELKENIKKMSIAAEKQKQNKPLKEEALRDIGIES